MIGNNKILFAGLVSLISLGSCNDHESFVSESLTNAPILGDASNAANGSVIV